MRLKEREREREREGERGREREREVERKVGSKEEEQWGEGRLTMVVAGVCCRKDLGSAKGRDGKRREFYHWVRH